MGLCKASAWHTGSCQTSRPAALTRNPGPYLCVICTISFVGKRLIQSCAAERGVGE